MLCQMMTHHASLAIGYQNLLASAHAGLSVSAIPAGALPPPAHEFDMHLDVIESPSCLLLSTVNQHYQ